MRVGAGGAGEAAEERVGGAPRRHESVRSVPAARTEGHRLFQGQSLRKLVHFLAVCRSQIRIRNYLQDPDPQ